MFSAASDAVGRAASIVKCAPGAVVGEVEVVARATAVEAAAADVAASGISGVGGAVVSGAGAKTDVGASSPHPAAANTATTNSNANSVLFIRAQYRASTAAKRTLRDNRQRTQTCYTISMLDRMVRQLEIAGQELAPFIEFSGSVTPMDSKGKWRAKLIPLPQADAALDAITQAVRNAPNPDRIPFTLNWKNMLGRVDLDRSNEELYVVHVEKMAKAGSSP